MLGRTREEILANGAVTVPQFHPDDRDDFLASITRDVVARQPFVWEGRMILHGATRWVHFEARPRPLADGGSVWTGALFDITPQREAQEERARLEARSRQLQRAESLGRMASAVAMNQSRSLASAGDLPS